MYTAVTTIPGLSQISFFQWETPDNPAPRLANPIVASDTTLTFTAPPLDHTGSVVSTDFLMGIENSDGYVETVHVHAGDLSVDGLTATGVTRGIRLEGLDWTTGDSTLAADFNQDSAVFCNISGVLQAMNTAALTGQIGANIKFDGRMLYMGDGVQAAPVFANTTARDAALPSPQNGDSCYVTADGVFYDYQSGSWQDRANGATPNASTTVAGKTQQATLADQIAKTETGSTGAPLFMNPKNTAVNSGDAAEGALVKLNSSGLIDNSLINFSNLEAARVLLNAPAGEAVDGSTTPQLVYISDGTNSKTAGAFYKADADNTTDVAILPVGFITVNASSVGTTYSIKVGTISGFTGLTPGATYYSSSTAGAITTSITSDYAKPIGRAVTTTTLLAGSATLAPVTYATKASTVTIGATVNVDVYTGFKARCVAFQLYMETINATNSDIQIRNFAGAFDQSVNGYYGIYSEAGGTVGSPTFATIAPISPTGLTVLGQGANNCSDLTCTITVNADYVRFAFHNAINSGIGSNQTPYELATQIYPY